MKNDLTKYMMKKNFKTNVIWSAIISAAVSLVFIILAVCIRGTADGEEELNNFATFIILFFSSFICSAGVCIVGINMSINMNRSRKTAVKAMFTTVIAAVVVCSGLALAASSTMTRSYVLFIPSRRSRLVWHVAAVVIEYFLTIIS